MVTIKSQENSDKQTMARKVLSVLCGLTSLRREKQLTQEALSQQLGISRQALYRFEVGCAVPRLQVLMGICRLLDCEVWQLFHPHPREAEEALRESKAGREEPLPHFCDTEVISISFQRDGTGIGHLEDEPIHRLPHPVADPVVAPGGFDASFINLDVRAFLARWKGLMESPSAS